MRVLLNMLAATMLVMLLALLGCEANQPVAQAATTNDLAFENLGNGIYVHYGAHLDIDDGYTGDICNISFVVGERGVGVIDTGGSIKVGQQLLAAIQKVTDKPILYVINTHVHPDHIFGNAAFIASNANETKPVFVGHAKLAAAMQLRQEAYDKLNIRLLGEDAKGSVMVEPTLLVDKPVDLDLGGRTLKVTPYQNAHTNTDITVQDSQTQTLFAGDLLFVERTPVIDGDIKGLIATLDTLKTYPFKQVVPGHGTAQKSHQDGITAINNAERYLNALLTDIRAIIKNGGDMKKAMSMAAASEKDKWVLFDVANRRNVNTIFPALEWE